MEHLPSSAGMSSIAEIQDRKEHEILQKYQSASTTRAQDQAKVRHQELEAARTLQRTYRGHRERRQLQGLSLDPSARWTEAIKEAQYRSLIVPRPRTSTLQHDGASPPPTRYANSAAHGKWAAASKIARRANADEESSLSSSSSSSTPITDSQREDRRLKRRAEKQDRVKTARTMDLSYFLEMVDVKHRYGSNLRKYHAEWKSRPTKENFFYWLDHGEGLAVELPKCSRERLDSMQVRYLGREERMLYEVVVGEQGKLVWRKDGVKVDTSDGWRDSTKGIVRVDDPAPAWADRPAQLNGSSESSGMDSETETSDSEEANETAGTQGADEEATPSAPQQSTSPPQQGPKHLASLQKIIKKPSEIRQKKIKKKNKKKKQSWIFVADAKNNLYISIKQSGAFQHSSFLHGSRISAAGLITVKDGQLRMLQPRSGHYRTPSHNLRLFIKSLQSRGVDMAATAVGGSYAAMVGIEAYMKTKGRLGGLKQGVRGMVLGRGKDGEGIVGGGVGVEGKV